MHSLHGYLKQKQSHSISHSMACGTDSRWLCYCYLVVHLLGCGGGAGSLAVQVQALVAGCIVDLTRARVDHDTSTSRRISSGRGGPGTTVTTTGAAAAGGGGGGGSIVRSKEVGDGGLGVQHHQHLVLVHRVDQRDEPAQLYSCRCRNDVK
jgi:hypothetical protein